MVMVLSGAALPDTGSSSRAVLLGREVKGARRKVQRLPMAFPSGGYVGSKGFCAAIGGNGAEPHGAPGFQGDRQGGTGGCNRFAVHRQAARHIAHPVWQGEGDGGLPLRPAPSQGFGVK